MATIKITTTEEEQNKVLEAIKELPNESVSMAVIAKKAGLSTSRVRYAIADLVDSNKIRKIPTKCINPRYIRYKYEIVLK
jgi:predicted HTH transcriptional regulator